MQIFKQIIKTTMSVKIMTLVILLNSPLATFADDCGREDRVDVPRLRRNSFGYRQSIESITDVVISSTLKFDIPNARDKLKTVYVLSEAGPDIVKTGKYSTVKCCPRYNRCS